MIRVVTTIDLVPDQLGDFLSILNKTVPSVIAEQGCLAYQPMVDVDSGLPTQVEFRQNTVTLVEAWVDLDALHAHLKASHIASFREAVKDCVLGVSHQVLQPV